MACLHSAFPLCLLLSAYRLLLCAHGTGDPDTHDRDMSVSSERANVHNNYKWRPPLLVTAGWARYDAHPSLFIQSIAVYPQLTALRDHAHRPPDRSPMKPTFSSPAAAIERDRGEAVLWVIPPCLNSPPDGTKAPTLPERKAVVAMAARAVGLISMLGATNLMSAGRTAD